MQHLPNRKYQSGIRGTPKVTRALCLQHVTHLESPHRPKPLLRLTILSTIDDHDNGICTLVPYRVTSYTVAESH